MAPRKTDTRAPAAQAPTAIPMTTLSGFAVSVMAFIPIDAKDLRKQAEIPMLLLDIQEGKKDISALAPYLKNVEFRQQHVRKRFTVEEATAMLAKAPDLTAEDLKEMTHTPEDTDINSDGQTADEDPDHDPETGEIHDED